MPSIFAIIIVICSGLAFSICLREMLQQGLEALSNRRTEATIRTQMKTVDFQLTGLISDQWLDGLIASVAEKERAGSRTGLQRFDYMVWMIGLSIVSFGGLVAGFAHLAAL